METNKEQIRIIDPSFRHHSFEQTQSILDCSRSFIYTQIRKGNLEPIYIGRKPYFSIDQINSLLETA